MDRLVTLFLFCKSILDIEIHFDAWTFTLWELFVATIFFALIGWVIGKLLWIK